MIRVTSVEQLKEILNCPETKEFFIQLRGFRSWKQISFDGTDKFYILNEIDNTEQVLTEKELFDKNKTNIGEAITKGAFFHY